MRHIVATLCLTRDKTRKEKLGTLHMTLVLFVLPVTLSPFLVAGGMLLSGLMAGVLVRNLHKRI